jgi:hypothetical protein
MRMVLVLDAPWSNPHTSKASHPEHSKQINNASLSEQ